MHDVAHAPGLTQFTPRATDEGEGRHEPQVFGARVPADPYSAWLAQRDAERQEEPVRWVFRPRMLDTPGVRAGTAKAKANPTDDRRDSEERTAGVRVTTA
jgi:hypothetical protein